MFPGLLMIVICGAYLAGLIFAWEQMIVFRHVRKSVNWFGEKWGRIGQIASASIGVVIGIVFLFNPPGPKNGNQVAAAPGVPSATTSANTPASSTPPASATSSPTSLMERPEDIRNRIAGASQSRPGSTAPSIPNSFTNPTIPGPGQPPGGVATPSVPPSARTALPPVTTTVPVTPPTSSAQSTPPTQPKAASTPSVASASPLAAKPVVAEAPESWPLPKPVLQENGQIPDDKALKAISLSLRNPETGEVVTDETPLEVGTVVLAAKKGAGLRLAAVRDIKEGGVLSVAFLGDKTAPMEVTRADLKLPAESIRNLVVASGWSIPAKMPLSKGMLLETERPGNRFRTVAILESLADGKVKIHYIGWGADTVARSTLRFPTGVTVD